MAPTFPVARGGLACPDVFVEVGGWLCVIGGTTRLPANYQPWKNKPSIAEDTVHDPRNGGFFFLNAGIKIYMELGWILDGNLHHMY
jgi:hypothetical protein